MPRLASTPKTTTSLGCTYISATVPLGTPGRVRSNVTLLSSLSVLFSCLLRGPHPKAQIPCAHSQSPFCSLLAAVFRAHFLTAIGAKRSQHGSLKTAKNQKKLQKSNIKTHPQSRPAKRLRLEGAKPRKLMTVTQFQLFFQRPRAPKREPKWEPKWSLGAPKITKNR